MGEEERLQQRVISVAQTVAMQAMELPPDQRPAFIRRAVAAIRRDFEQKHGADPETTAAAEKLQALIVSLVKIIEETGGSIGHA